MLTAVRNEVIEHWTPIRHLISVPKTDEQCENMIELLNGLLDEVSDNENHPLYPLIETLGTLIEDYETKTIPEPQTTPAGILQFLIEENNLTSEDLRELGTDQVIYELLNGAREFDLKQIKYLCSRFHLKPDLFLTFQ